MYVLGVIRSKESEIPKYLGVYVDESLTWSKHIEEITKKITAGISALKRLRGFASRDVLVSVYNALIMPHFDYCCEVWDSLLGSVLAERLQKLHSRCARVIMRYKNEAGQSELALPHLGWSLLSERRFHIKARQMFKVLHDLAPARLCNIFRNSCSANSYQLRNADNKLALPLPKTVSATMVLGSGIPYQMKYVIVKLCLCLISLFQPIDQMSFNYQCLRVIFNVRIVLITVVSIFSIF